MTDFNSVKLIALDLDETTLNDRGELTERTRRAISSAVQDGIYVVIASGRAYSALPRELLDIKGVEYAITSNGAALYRISDGSCINCYKIDSRSVLNILDIKNRWAVTYEAFIDGIAYADSNYIKNPQDFGVPLKAKHYLETTRKPVDDMKAFMLKNSNALDSIDIVVSSLTVRDEISAYIKAKDKQVYVTSSVPYLVEVAPIEAGKGAALKRLCTMLGVDLSDCVAFGNADNDIEMLTECGLGVAVANATQGCLSAADVIAPSHSDDGVAKMIEQILNK